MVVCEERNLSTVELSAAFSLYNTLRLITSLSLHKTHTASVVDTVPQE